MTATKLTEDQTIELLIKYLKQNGYSIVSYCLGHTRGCDIVAEKDNRRLYIEAKGARANPTAHNKKREFFTSGQIKTHFGKAIVKALETKRKYPDSDIAIAHPFDEKIKKVIGNIIPELKALNIIHFWVDDKGNIIREI